MSKDLKRLQEDGLKDFSNQVEEINDSQEHLKALDDALFSPKGMNQVEIAKSKLQEQKKNPIRIYPYKKVDTRSAPSLDIKHMKLRSHLSEWVDVMIQRVDGKTHPIELILAIMPGDPACFWKIPVNTVVQLQRGLALHLKNNCVWVKIKHQEKSMEEKARLSDLSLSTDIVVDSIHTDFQILDAKAL